jgi:hypothetical protein
MPGPLKRKFLRFSGFAPDGPEFGNEDLKKSENALPLFGGWRPMRKKEILATEADTEPINSAYAHLAPSDPFQYARPYDIVEDITDKLGTADYEWWDTFPEKGVEVGTDFAELVNKGISDDSSGIYLMRSLTQGDVDPMWTFLLTDVDEPAGVYTGGEVKLVVRYKNSDIANMEFTLGYYPAGGPYTAVTGVKTLTEEDFTRYEYSLTAGEATALKTHFGELAIQFKGTNRILSSISGQLDAIKADIENGSWVREDGNVENLFESVTVSGLLGGPYNDTTYILSPGLVVGEEAYWVGQVDPQEYDLPPTGGAGIVIPFVRASVNSADTEMDLKMELIQNWGEEDELLISENTERLTESLVNYGIVTTDEEANTVTDITALALKLTAKRNSEAALDDQVGRPDGHTDLSEGAWTAVGAATIHEAVADESDATYMQSPNSNDKELTQLNLGTIVDPASYGHTKITLRVQRDGGTSDDRMNVYVKDKSGNFIAWKGGTTAKGSIPSSGWATKSWEGTPGWWAGNVDYDDFEIQVRKYRDGFDDLTSNPRTWRLKVSRIEVETDTIGGQVKVTELGVVEDRIVQPRFTELEAEVNNLRGKNVGDDVTIYCGNESKLYEVNDIQFTDLTDTAGAYPNGYADYAVDGLDKPPCWDFASWGTWIIATNYVNPIQVLKPGDAFFSDLVTTTDYPSASATAGPHPRWIEVVNSFLVGADHNPDHWDDGKPYSVGWSAFGNPEEWYILDESSQSTFSQLVAVPGQITHLSGGEYGVVFKRNSILRMSYTGFPRIFNFDIIATRQGCPYGKSVVAVDNNLFFWGNGGIFVVSNGSQVQRISTGRVEKFLFDSEFEPSTAVQSNTPLEEIDIQSLVHGSYDPHSGLIWWWYRKSGDNVLHNSRALIYNVNENRFSEATADDFDYGTSTASLTITNDLNTFTKSLHMFRGDDTNIYYEAFLGFQSYQMDLRTKTWSAAEIDGNPQTAEIYIDAVRPIFRGNVGWAAPDTTISISASEEPFMQRLLDSRTVSKRDEDRDGWYSVGKPISGEFFEFDFILPEGIQQAQYISRPAPNPDEDPWLDIDPEPTPYNVTKEVLGLQIRYSIGGEV